MHPKHKILNWIWKLNLPPKIKVFLWLTIRKALPTCDFLISRQLEITNTCYLFSKIAKILIMFSNCALLPKEYVIVLNVIVPLLSSMRVISFLSLNRFTKAIKPIAIFLSNQWKKLQLSFGAYEPIGIRWFLGKSNPTSFSLLRKLNQRFKIFMSLKVTLILAIKGILCFVKLKNGFDGFLQLMGDSIKF